MAHATPPALNGHAQIRHRKQQAFLAAYVACTGNITQAAQSAKVSRQSVLTWRQQDPAFMAASLNLSLFVEGRSGPRTGPILPSSLCVQWPDLRPPIRSARPVRRHSDTESSAETERSSHKPTVSLDVISLVANRCGYYRSHIEPRAAHEFAMHVATQRELATWRQHRHAPRAQPVALLRERHGRRPRLPPRRGTEQAPHREQGHPGDRTREEK